MAIKTIRCPEFQNLINGEKTVLVVFCSPRCSYCNRIDHAYEKIVRQDSLELVVVKVNVDEEPLLAEKEGIEVVPTLVLYRNGEDIGAVVAPESKSMIEGFIQELIGTECVAPKVGESSEKEQSA